MFSAGGVGQGQGVSPPMRSEELLFRTKFSAFKRVKVLCLVK